MKWSKKEIVDAHVLHGLTDENYEFAPEIGQLVIAWAELRTKSQRGALAADLVEAQALNTAFEENMHWWDPDDDSDSDTDSVDDEDDDDDEDTDEDTTMNY